MLNTVLRQPNFYFAVKRQQSKSLQIGLLLSGYNCTTLIWLLETLEIILYYLQPRTIIRIAFPLQHFPYSRAKTMKRILVLSKMFIVPIKIKCYPPECKWVRNLQIRCRLSKRVTWSRTVLFWPRTSYCYTKIQLCLHLRAVDTIKYEQHSANHNCRSRQTYLASNSTNYIKPLCLACFNFDCSQKQLSLKLLPLLAIVTVQGYGKISSLQTDARSYIHAQ